MTGWIVGSCVRLGRLVVAVAIAVVGFGVLQIHSAPVDSYPEFMPPTVQIQTDALGLSAAEVEQLITVPMEQDLLNGVPWLDHITSESMEGLSSIDLVFEQGTDILDARQVVQERLSQVAGLPNVGSRPVMLQPLSSTSRVVMIGLSSKSLSLIDMSVLARWKIRPKLMGVPGVANVAIWGQRDRQLQVQVDPEELVARGVSLNQVVSSTGNALWASPLTFVEANTPGTGGFIDTTNQRFGVQHILPITTAKQLASVTLEDTSGRRLRLGDVAHVVENHQPLIGDALTEQGPSLMLVVQKFPESDTLKVTRDVEAALNTLAPGLAGIHVDTHVFRPANFIEASLRDIGIVGLVALVLVLLTLGLVTFSWRVTLIAFVAIPVSLVAAALVLELRGTTFNSITVAGLAVALGAVVDDAVVDVERIRRRFRERVARGGDEPPDVTVVEASREVRPPLYYATIVILALVVPLAVQAGGAGAFSRELAVSYTLAVLASLLVALTLTPALAFMLLRSAPDQQRTSPVVGWARRGFDRVASKYLGRPRSSYVAVGALVVLALAALPQLGSRSLLPNPQDRDLLVQLRAAPGTSLPEMDRIATTMSSELRQIDGVRAVGADIGRAVRSDQVVNVNSGELWVSMDGSADYGSTVDAISNVVSGYPGVSNRVLTYEKERLGASEPLTRDLVVRLFGQNFGVLQAKAEEVRRAIAGVDGVVAPRVETQPQEPTVEVEVNLAAAQKYGIKPGDVRRATATLLSGLLVGSLYEQQKIFDVVVWGSPTTRHNVTTVRRLLIDTPSGGHVRLGEVAAVRLAPYPVVIRHQGISRTVDVTADVDGRSLAAVTREVTGQVQAMTFPMEYHAEVAGGNSAHMSSDRRMLGLGLAALVGIYLLLQAGTGSWRVATLLVLTIPLAVVGGLVTAYLVGGVMSAGALLGLLLVAGVATRNGVVLVAGFRRLEAEGQGDPTDRVLRTTRDRLVPVLVTAVTVAASLLPFALSGEIAGTEILHPLAVVALGGLVTATLVTLMVLPSLYLRFATGKEVSHDNA